MDDCSGSSGPNLKCTHLREAAQHRRYCVGGTGVKRLHVRTSVEACCMLLVVAMDGRCSLRHCPTLPIVSLHTKAHPRETDVKHEKRTYTHEKRATPVEASELW